MKSILVAAVALATLAGPVSNSQAKAQQPEPSSLTKHETPFACNRLALSPEQRKRHFDELGPTLLSLKTGARELPDGYEFQFPTDTRTYQLLAEWVAGERACCPFFDVDLRADREGGPIWLRLTGREGVKQFIRADGAAWLK